MRCPCHRPPATLKLSAEIVAQHGAVLFHQSGGGYDGSSPMRFAQGEIDGAPFYISRPQFASWQHTQLNIDVVPMHLTSMQSRRPQS